MQSPSQDTLLQVQEECENDRRTTTNTTSKSLWDAYCSFVHENHVTLELMDAGLSRILFWAPTAGANAERRHQQREILYGILSLHRLAIDAALQQQQDSSHTLVKREDHGMTVCPNPDQPTKVGDTQEDSTIATSESTKKNWHVLSPTALRITLTVLQSLLPSILELARSSHTNSEDDARQRRVRLYLERIKFALRLTLLGSYWARLRQQQTHKLSSQEGIDIPQHIGLMTEGGLYHLVVDHHNNNGCTSVAQLDAQWERQTYVGRRTGRTVVRPTRTGTPPPPMSKRPSRLQPLLVAVGEVLYAYRPLYWAHAEASQEGGNVGYRTWILAMLMDLVALNLCHSNSNTATSNAATQTELSRRKTRLLLYLLRTPVWDRWTEPGADRLEDLLERLPVLGRLASTYLRDWLWYMKHPYHAEQG